MILGFKTKTKTGPTHFPAKILMGDQVQPTIDNIFEYDLAGAWGSKPKIHTLREDAGHRWRANMQIHFATGVRTPNYKQFASGTCTGVQSIFMSLDECRKIEITIDQTYLYYDDMVKLAQNDGFQGLTDFVEWFEPLIKKAERNGNHGLGLRLIHWTPFRY